MKGKTNESVQFRLWVYAGREKLLGKGRVELLERINSTGSISSAAREMKMSYRQAWQMVEEMNERSKKPLVLKQLGGKSGGGATLSQTGLNAINQFHKIESKVKRFIERESGKLKL